MEKALSVIPGPRILSDASARDQPGAATNRHLPCARLLRAGRWGDTYLLETALSRCLHTAFILIRFPDEVPETQRLKMCPRSLITGR